MARTDFLSRRRFSIGGAAVLLALCGAVSRTMAQPATAGVDAAAAQSVPSADQNRTIEELVSDLASPDFATRERATAALSSRENISQTAIEAQIGRTDISPEQLGRLMVASRDRFVRSPRAAMGVQFVNDFQMSERAMIDRTFPGFPSHDLNELQKGDEIIAINGRQPDPSIARLVFRPMIIACEPGDVMHVKIVRDGKIIERDVHVGRYENLSQQPGTASRNNDVALAWAARSESYPMAGGRDENGKSAPINPGLSVDEWAKATQTPQAVVDRSRAVSESVLGSSVTAGGQTAGTLPAVKSALANNEDDGNWGNINGRVVWTGRGAQMNAPVAQIRPGTRVPAAVAGGFAGRFPAAGIDPFQDMLDAVMIQRDQMKKLVLAQTAIAGDPAQPEAIRSQARADLRVYEMQLRALDIQSNQIRMMMQQQGIPRK